MSSPIRLGWVGCAHIHTPGFVRQVVERGYECAGVYDHDTERAAKNAALLSGSVSTLEALVANESVTGYVICSETVHHLELVRAIIATGKPIFVEKPMGTGAENSAAILELFEAHGNAFHTGYFMRGTRAVRTLKKMVEEGKFGQITRVRGSNCHSGALGGWFDGEWRWMADRSQSGVGAFGDLGTHALDILLWIFGDVRAVTGILGMGTARYEGCDEFGEAILAFQSGTVGTLAAAWDDVANPSFLTVSGTEGYATIGRDFTFTNKSGETSVIEELEPEAVSGFGAFLDHLEGKPAELVTAAEAAARDRAMNAIYQGAESATWVSL